MERGEKKQWKQHRTSVRSGEKPLQATSRKKKPAGRRRARAPRQSRLVHVSFDHPLSLVSENLRGSSSLVQQGSTQNFVISYDPSLGQAGAVIANYLLTACEYDYSQVQPLFGIVPSGLPFQVAVVYSASGAWHNSPCSNTSIFVGALSTNPPDATFFRMLTLSEVVEVLEANLARGWACAQSHGEALSRVIPDDLIKWKKPINYLSAAYWLNSPRVDWVNNTENTDQDYYSIGCGVLFLNWMRFQLRIPWNQIIAAGSSTLAQTYTKITGSSDGYATFRALVDARFPVGTPVALESDNVFPL